ncbi:SIR2 family protein [Hydrogenophaga luteola]|uniref:NAD(+) hydrolase ThsA n=1 Tax=Hydrogenophaga luteola TaxID=1591122 RepID=A0ABV7W0U6_9BURK
MPITPDHEIQAFIKAYVSELQSDSAAIFAGAGMSKAAGYVDWRELLAEIAQELGLDIKLEHDLIAVAQYHVNQRGGNSDGVAKKILQEFSEQAEPSEVHQIIARLPIGTYWTTNYDTLIEEALRAAFRVADVKHKIEQLTSTKPKRDAVVYKMHGDVSDAHSAVLYKAQYERYHVEKAPFITALLGDLVSKTFLFVGFSFSDPNLDYVLSRLHIYGNAKRTHYCIMKAVVAEDPSNQALEERRQELRVNDLKRFGIQTLLVAEYSEIPRILKRIESGFRKRTVFFSGSAEEYGSWDRQTALAFVHNLSMECVKQNCRVVNGFGWGVGSAVINGALEAIYGNPQKFSEDQLIVRPFPQHGGNLKELWEQYRQRMISLAGVAVFVFGNKLDDTRNLVPANGVHREFQIAMENGLVPIPVGATGYVAEELWNETLRDPAKYYPGIEGWILPIIQELGRKDLSPDQLTRHILEIIRRLNK